MRFLGGFLADPTDVPADVVVYVAEQVGTGDVSCLNGYVGRRATRFEHAAQIVAAYGYRDFAAAEAELVQWLDDRVWTTGEGPTALLDGAVRWLRERLVLLPGVTTLTRLVARERDAATLRVWTELARPASAGQSRLLRELLVVPDGSRRSGLDRMRKAETVTSGAGMVRALRRVSDVSGLARCRARSCARPSRTSWRSLRRPTPMLTGSGAPR